mgnify:FL=1|jgi:DNA-directed RNA polymerase subunit F
MLNYPKDQVKQAIEILEAMLQDNAPSLSYEFEKYYEYMKLCWKHKQEQSEALSKFENAMSKVVNNNVNKELKT